MPMYDLSSEDIRCGRGATKSGPGTKTADILPGSTMSFIVGRSADEPLEPYIIYHNGPGQAYLSRAPDGDLDRYEGDGEWIKIGYLGPMDDTNWSTRGQTGMNFSIPETTPPGKYLLRVEHLYVRSEFNSTQFYVACAQVNVLGEGKGDMGKGVRFPGAYRLEDPGIWVGEEMYEWPLKGLSRYVPPGPPVWRG